MQEQHITPEIASNISIPSHPKSKNILIFGVSLLFISIVLYGGWIFFKHADMASQKQALSKKVSSNYTKFTDSEGIFTFAFPKDFAVSTFSRYITDSCDSVTNISLQPLNNGPTITQSVSPEKYTAITVCYTAQEFPDAMPTEVSNTQTNFMVVSSQAIASQGYKGFKAKAINKYDKKEKVDLIILKSPYGGYATFTNDMDGEKIYEEIIDSFQFIKPTKRRFTTADQKTLRAIFLNQYKANTVTFSYPSEDESKVGGMAYLPEGQRCFNADRKANVWKILYIGKDYMDDKCYNFFPKNMEIKQK